MAYQGICKENPPLINYFSNPDIDYMGLPTGTATADNARCIRESMVRPPTLTCHHGTANTGIA